MALQQLIEALGKLNELHLEMLDTSVKKKRAIIHNEYDDFVKALTKESKLLKRIEEQEHERTSAALAFLQEKGIKSRLNLTISEISRLVFDVEDKKRLLSVQQELLHNLTALKEINALNQELIKQSLSFIDFSLNLMIATEDEVTYAPPDQQSRQHTRSGVFDTKA